MTLCHFKIKKVLKLWGYVAFGEQFILGMINPRLKLLNLFQKLI
jgi:hypothetical protein